MRIHSQRGHYRYVRCRWRVLFALFDAVGYLCFLPFQKLLARKRSRVPATGDVRRILLVQLDHLGDAVITLRTLHRLRERFPCAAIDVLCSPWTAELFDAAADVSRVFVSQNNRFCRQRRWTWWLSTLRWGLRLRLRRYDVAFDVRGEAPLAALLWILGARFRVGWNCGGGGFFLTHSPAYLQNRSEFASREALWTTLPLEDLASSHGESEIQLGKVSSRNLAHDLNIDDIARRNVNRRLASLPPAENARIVLHLGAGTPAKRWPLEHWRSLVERLTLDGRATLILVGTREEQPLADAVKANHDSAVVADWTGELGIIELGYLLEQADLFVGADSGPAHLAASMQTPTVVLFSGTNNAEQWQPVGCHVHVLSRRVACSPCHRSECTWSDHPCLRGISPARVAKVVKEVLASRTNLTASRLPIEDEPQVIELLESPSRPN